MIVVIAILAAITIVSYNGIQNRAYDSAVQADLDATIKKLALFTIDNNHYPTNIADLATLGIRISRSSYATAPTTPTNFTMCYSDDGSSIAIAALSKSGHAYYSFTQQDASIHSLAEWYPNSATNRCKSISDSLSNIDGSGTYRNYNGYSEADTDTGPWRAWIGGN